MVTDGMKSTKWCIDAPARLPYFVILEAAEPIALKEYTLVTGNDTGGSPGRNWNVWKVYAGNFASDADAARDAEGWVLIDKEIYSFCADDGKGRPE